MATAHTATNGLDTSGNRVAGKAKRRRRKRTKTATTERRIQAKARERQKLWAEGDPAKANAIATLTTDLNGRDYVHRPEGLFAEGRQETAGEMEPGHPTTTRFHR